MTFVDLAGAGTVIPRSLDRLTTAMQDNAHRTVGHATLLIRWPWLDDQSSQRHGERIEEWLARLTGEDGSPRVIPDGVDVGVVLHRVGEATSLYWAQDAQGQADPERDRRSLTYARALELSALLDVTGAIRSPKNYHFRLPNGDHADRFVRLADAIASPRDAWVLASWLTARLRNGAGIVMDNGSMTPLVVQLEAFAAASGLALSRVAILDSYPSARAAVRTTVESAIDATSDVLIGIQSVSSSGGLSRILEEELIRAADQYGLSATLDVLVDLRAGDDQCELMNPPPGQAITRWLALGDGDEYAGVNPCELCTDPARAAVSAIDPTTYLEIPYPRPRLVMPDKAFAEAAQGFWQRVDEMDAVAFDASPHPASKIARGKRTPLPVRPFFELIARPEGLTDAIATRVRGDSSFEALSGTGLVVATAADLATVPWPAFAGTGETNLARSLRSVLDGVRVPADAVITDDHAEDLRERVADAVGAGRSVLVFSWAAVTGLTLRRLKLAVADQLTGLDGALVNGLVMMSRPADPADWTAARNQFHPGQLLDLWQTCFPWRSPTAEEQALLDRSDVDRADLSPEGRAFLDRRLRYLRYHLEGEQVAASLAAALDPTLASESIRADDWSPRFDFHRAGGARPDEVFWGMSDAAIHQTHVRGHSLYGRELSAPVAYGAIGSVVNFTRHNEAHRGVPSWLGFNMNRLVRSYFDAIIVCSVLRWLRPGEPWWYGDSGLEDDDAIDAVRFLIDQVPDVAEQVLLIPELLLATALGKVPLAAREEVRRQARLVLGQWEGRPQLAHARGAVEVGLLLTADPANPDQLAGDATDDESQTP